MAGWMDRGSGGSAGAEGSGDHWGSGGAKQRQQVQRPRPAMDAAKQVRQPSRAGAGVGVAPNPGRTPPRMGGPGDPGAGARAGAGIGMAPGAPRYLGGAPGMGPKGPPPQMPGMPMRGAEDDPRARQAAMAQHLAQRAQLQRGIPQRPMNAAIGAGVPQPTANKGFANIDPSAFTRGLI